MRSVLRVLFSALLGIGIALAADHFFPRQKAENRQIVDTPKIAENPSIATPSKKEPLKTNDLPVSSPGQMSRSDRDQARIRGYVVKGGKVNVLLSDGRTLTERDGLTRVSRNSVEIDGETFWLADSKDKPAPSVPPQSSAPVDSTGEKPVGLPPAPKPPESSWETADDGVSRLKATETLAEAFKR
jgi:hypothetical protein